MIGGAALSNTIPGRPGEFARAYWGARATQTPITESVGTVVVDRAADVLVLLLALAASTPFVPRPSWFNALELVGLGIGGVIILALVLAWWYTHHSSRGRKRATGGIVRSRYRAAARKRSQAAPPGIDPADSSADG